MDTSDAIRQNVKRTLTPPPPPKTTLEPVGFMDYFTKVNYFNK